MSDSAPIWFPTAAGLARVCSRLGARREAAILYSAMLPYAGTFVVSSVAHNCYGTTELYLALLAAAIGRARNAANNFEAALVANARMRAWPALVHTQYEYARFLLGRSTRTGLVPGICCVKRAARRSTSQ